MTLNFPSSPTNGQLFNGFVWDASAGVWKKQNSIKFSVGATPPVSPLPGDGWFDSDTGTTAVYYNDGSSSQWVELGNATALGPTGPTGAQGATGPTGPIGPTGASYSVDTIDSLTDVVITSPQAGQKLIYNGTNWVNLTGYVFVQTLYYTANNTFVKANYPWLRAIRVKAIGGGGGGGGAIATGASQFAAGGGGSGGDYVETFFTNITGMGSTLDIIIGTGANGSTGSAVAGSGGTTQLGGIVLAGGGTGGTGGAVQTAFSTTQGGAGSTAASPWISGQTLTVPGAPGSPGIAGGTANSAVAGGIGGASFLASGGPSVSAGSNGANGLGYGAGGGGATNPPSQATARTGGSGIQGILIVELYA